MARARKSDGKGRERKETPRDPAQPESLGVDRSDREAGRPVELDRKKEPETGEHGAGGEAADQVA